MVAYEVPNVGTLHLHADGRTADDRISYRYVIENAAGVELETGNDLSSGVGAPVNYVDTMESLLSFLGASAERAEYGSDDGSSFNKQVTAWAVEFSDELAMAREMVNTNPGDHPEECTSCRSGMTSAHLPQFA
jgi:hypothetical protein